MWYEAHGTMESAIAWEKAIKKWRRGLGLEEGVDLGDKSRMVRLV